MGLPMPLISAMATCRSALSGRSLALISAIGLLLLAAGCTQPATDSDAYAARLADHLTATGAVMYGAYWCPHCEAQKELFGAAMEAIPYVECDPEGENAQPELCQAKNIEGYPTWEIDGQLYPGVQPLGGLAKLSDFPDDNP
ncbi:hypothetical protein C7271_21160 [filamentous cyanobacterium CCP5]|nr:hypothetical protein C7271_21160 [filamentous cyanobacterium CCP5]